MAAPAVGLGLEGTAAQPLEAALSELSQLLGADAGAVILRPGVSGRPRHRFYNARFDCLRGYTLLRPTSATEVQAILAWAGRHRKTLSICGGGHSFEGKSSHPELVLDLARMKRLALRGDGDVIAGAGVLLGDVYKLLVAEGRMFPAGTCPTVGLVGHVLGGGIGDFLPMLGYAAQSLKDVSLVTFSGRAIRVGDGGITILDGGPPLGDGVDARTLMRALRGGGQGAFGVVTEMAVVAHDVSGARLATFRLETTSDVPPRRAAAIFQAWQAWRATLTEELRDKISSKLEVSRSESGFSFRIAGLIMIRPDARSTVAEARRSLEPVFQLQDLRNRRYVPTVDLGGAVRSFLDDEETTKNPSRRHLYGSSSMLTAALARPAVEHLFAALPAGVDAAFYTAGGKAGETEGTSLHRSEFIVEWTSYRARRDATAHRRMRTFVTGLMRAAGHDDLGFPNYPDSEPRDYFPNRAEIERLRAVLDPGRISTSGLVAPGERGPAPANCG